MKSMPLPLQVPLFLAAILLVEDVRNQGITQTRYSVNVVGYSDADFVAGSNLVANPRNAGNNTLSNLFDGVPSGSLLFPRGRATPRFIDCTCCGCSIHRAPAINFNSSSTRRKAFGIRSAGAIRSAAHGFPCCPSMGQARW
jgi:hypothetical protein